MNVILGSSHEGEEIFVVQALTDMDINLILAPRHPERFSKVIKELENFGLRGIRMSSLQGEANIKINDNELYGDVRFMFPMLMGHQVWISIGNYDLDTHIDFLQSYEKLNIEIIDKDSFKSEEYFDIPSNIWSLIGLNKAIEEGKSLCLSLLS